VLLQRDLRVPTTRGALTGGALVDVVLLTVLHRPGAPATVHRAVPFHTPCRRWCELVDSGDATLSVARFGLLFLFPAGPGDVRARRMGHIPGPGFDHHLRGMWIAFVVATALTAYFVFQFSRAIGLQREQIASLREASARSARLAALTTLAAGAAHELNNPLGTIAVASHEAALALAAHPACAAVREDPG
jgi:two-component system sensor histidine kinase RegB